jgi:hypothetical protein
MKPKNMLYAAVGGPVVAVRKVGDKIGDLRSKLSEEATGYTQVAEKTIDEWAAEGEKIINRISEGKVVDEITAKVDLDQAKEQVTKLRDQLEDMLATWRTSFRPEKAENKVEAAPAETPARTSQKAPAKAPAKATAKKPAAGKPAAKTSATKPSAAKTSKTSAAKTSQAKAS